MGGTDDPTIGDALFGLLLIVWHGVIVPAAFLFPLLGLGIWLTHLVRHRRR